MKQSDLIIQNQLCDLTIGVKRAFHVQCTPLWRRDDFIPPFSSIGMILDGDGTMCVNDKEIHPQKGQLYLLPAGTVQSFSANADHPYEKYYCHFDAVCGGTNLFEVMDLPLCIDAKDPATVINLFQNMIQCINDTSLTSTIKVKQHMLNLLCYYLDCCPSKNIVLVNDNCDSPFFHAIQFVENNLDQSITVGKMAEIAGYHPSHFTKLFHKQFGVSPVQFIARKKLERAIYQLTATSASISAIAESLGFSNQFYFCSFFKKQTGVTPSDYRNSYTH